MSDIQSVIDFFRKNYSKEQFFENIKDIYFFFVKPSIFFKSFFEKSFEDQLAKILFYLVAIFALSVIFSDGSLYSVLREIIKLFLHNFLFYIILLMSFYIIKRIYPETFISSYNLFLFTIVTKMFFEFLFIAIDKLYISFERYEILFILNCLFIFYFFRLTISSYFLFFIKYKIAIIGAIICFILINLTIIITYLLSFDFNINAENSISNSIFRNIDPITVNYYRIVNSIDTLNYLDRYPYYTVLLFYEESKIKDRIPVYFEFIKIDKTVDLSKADESIFSPPFIFIERDSTNNFIELTRRIKNKNVEFIKSNKFKKNIELNELINDYILSLENLFNNPLANNSKLVRRATIKNDSTSLKRVEVFLTDSIYREKNFKIIEYMNKRDKNINITYFPLNLLVLYLSPTITILPNEALSKSNFF